MPLQPWNVTAASRKMLPTYPIFNILLGTLMIATPTTRRDKSPGVAFITSNIPGGAITWGAGFIALGVILGACWWRWHTRRPYQIGLSIAVVWLTAFSLALMAAAIWGGATWFGWLFPALAARAHYASLVSLEVRET